MKKVNRNDVARKAGVSVATVSRVFSGKDYVSNEKRKRVLKVAEEIGYKPNPVAISLKKNRTRQLMYYVRDLSNYYYIEMYKGMMDYAAQHGYRFIISGNLDYNQINSLMVDGLILSDSFFHSQELTDGLRIPVISASYRGIEDIDEKHVAVDTAYAMELAIDHLLDSGHRKIAFITLIKPNREESRKKAFLKLMRPYLGENCFDYIIGPNDFKKTQEEINYMDIGQNCAESYINRKLDATAAVCFNDAIAIGFMGYIQEKGIKVPGDLSIVGIDGHQQGCYTFPKLTSVSIDPFHHGSECARTLIDIIENKKTEPIPVEIKLLIRKSTKPLKQQKK